ncbi:hypothetical protein R1flu_014543 [Riccia fluitans]|uniref:Uncharacterized protein n=1 Tax=Riccia fluitans TaxID=41844 RepID=A0ABD1YK71_9MARC
MSNERAPEQFEVSQESMRSNARVHPVDTRAGTPSSRQSKTLGGGLHPDLCATEMWRVQAENPLMFQIWQGLMLATWPRCLKITSEAGRAAGLFGYSCWLCLCRFAFQAPTFFAPLPLHARVPAASGSSILALPSVQLPLHYDFVRRWFLFLPRQ